MSFRPVEQSGNAYSFLQTTVGFRSAIWLHDGFWIAPCPGDDALSVLHLHLSKELGFAADEPPLMRCDPLWGKRDQLLAQQSTHVQCTRPAIAGTETLHPLPPVVRIRRKRLFQAAQVEQQIALEQRLTKRARGGDTAKRRRLL